MFGELLKAAVGVVVLPVSLAADVVTLGGALTDKEEPYTVSNIEEVFKNLQDSYKD